MQGTASMVAEEPGIIRAAAAYVTVDAAAALIGVARTR